MKYISCITVRPHKLRSSQTSKPITIAVFPPITGYFQDTLERREAAAPTNSPPPMSKSKEAEHKKQGILDRSLTLTGNTSTQPWSKGTFKQHHLHRHTCYRHTTWGLHNKQSHYQNMLFCFETRSLYVWP